MATQNLLDMFIQERVNMLLYKYSKTKPKKTPEENEQIIQAEQIIDIASDKELELPQNYTCSFMALFACL